MMKYFIATYSDENDYVLDNTMGVGTTCLAAKELNRKFIGIEKEVKYYDLAVARVFG
jgi:site-specific DNA-methyltransferase (adenine-specific)